MSACQFTRVSCVPGLCSCPSALLTFRKVGSHSLPGLELFLHNNTSTNTNVSGPPHFAGHINAPSHSGYGSGSYQLPSRPSLPTLHTRSTFPTDYDSHSQYEDSPIDAYTYSASAIPRQDSFSSSSAYGVENYRSWSTSGSVSAPVTATYYEPHQTYTFGNLQAPAFTTGRLPSVTADTFSPLNMGHLNSSLPAQTVHERRLPIPQAPYTLQYPTTTYAGVELPEIRPLGSYTEPRVHINGIHSRNAMPWTTDGGSRGGSVASLAPPNGMTHSAPQTTTAAVTESVLGYQFSVAAPSAASSSPNISPTGGTRLSDSYANTSTASILPPCSNLRYTASVGTQGYDARPNTSRGSMAAPSASLYSFSTETPGSQQQSTSNSDRTGADEVPFMSATSYQPPLRQPQPQHAASIEALRRQSSFDQQRASTAHRMSVSNLNGRY